MVMVDNSEFMAEVHDRMPTILQRDDWDAWLQAAPDDAFTLCRIWDRPLLVDATPKPWAKPRQRTPSSPTLL